MADFSSVYHSLMFAVAIMSVPIQQLQNNKYSQTEVYAVRISIYTPVAEAKHFSETVWTEYREEGPFETLRGNSDLLLTSIVSDRIIKNHITGTNGPDVFNTKKEQSSGIAFAELTRQPK